MSETGFLELFVTGPWGRVFAGLWGAIWGSFFNVMIVRLPEGQSLIRPRSRCCSCGAQLAWYDNIPILSFFMLRGRCRQCGARYSARYVVVEILVTLLALAAHQVYVVSGMASLGMSGAQCAIVSLFCGLLTAIAFIDLATMRIPDAITYPAIPVAMGLSLFMGHPHYWDGLVGGIAGYAVIGLISGGYRLLTGRLGMGGGDAKLLALIGSLLGWQMLVLVLFLASFQGCLIGIPLLLLSRRGGSGTKDQPGSEGAGGSKAAPIEPPTVTDGDSDDVPAPSSSLRHSALPFGPYLSLAAIELLLLQRYLPLFLTFGDGAGA